MQNICISAGFQRERERERGEKERETERGEKERETDRDREKQNCWTSFIWDTTWDFQHCAILTSVDSDQPVHPSFQLTNSKWCWVSKLKVIEYLSDQQRLWTVCAYAHAGLTIAGRTYNIVGNLIPRLIYIAIKTITSLYHSLNEKSQ